jgi:hypothetical protein
MLKRVVYIVTTPYQITYDIQADILSPLSSRLPVLLVNSILVTANTITAFCAVKRIRAHKVPFNRSRHVFTLAIEGPSGSLLPDTNKLNNTFKVAICGGLI